jgi:endonuclease G
VFVHGRNQLGADTALLRRSWENALDSGLTAAGDAPLRDGDVRLAWYADALDPESDADCAIATNDSVSVTLSVFARGLLSLVPLDSARDARDVRSALSDVFYVMDRGKRCAAEQTVARLVDSVAAQRPVVIVAYSLGSVVAYDYLHDASRDVLRSVHLITLGSPLGVDVLRELLLDNAQASAPDGLASWTNIYDPDDDFAAPLHLSGDTLRLRDGPTLRPSRTTPHDVTHYLSDPATIDALRRALHSAS